jgi:plastocyanin
MRTRWAIAATLLVLPACSVDSTSTPGTTGSAPPGDTAERIEVAQHEYSITLPRYDFSAGTYTFTVDNLGQTGHDFAITGPGVDTIKRMPAGTEAEIIVTLQPGTYELWCSIDNHRTRGMRQTVIVQG